MFVKVISNENFFLLCWFLFVICVHGAIGVITLFMTAKYKTETQIKQDYLTAGDSTPVGFWINHKVSSSIVLGIVGFLSTAAMITSLVFNILNNKELFFTAKTLRVMLILVAIFGTINIIEIIMTIVEIKRLKKNKKEVDKSSETTNGDLQLVPLNLKNEKFGLKERRNKVRSGMICRIMYCSKCGERLVKKKETKTIKKGEWGYENHIYGYETIKMTEKQISRYVYICPHCGNVTTYDQQLIIRERQKKLSKKIIGTEE